MGDLDRRPATSVRDTNRAPAVAEIDRLIDYVDDVPLAPVGKLNKKAQRAIYPLIGDRPVS